MAASDVVPSGKHTKKHGKTQCLMGKSTISMTMFNGYVELPQNYGNSRFLMGKSTISTGPMQQR